MIFVVGNMLLGTLWLNMLYGKGFFVLLSMCVFENLVMLHVNAQLFYTLAKTLKTLGVFRRLTA